MELAGNLPVLGLVWLRCGLGSDFKRAQEPMVEGQVLACGGALAELGGFFPNDHTVTSQARVLNM